MALILFLAMWHLPAWLVHVANVAATVADIESTQSCLRAETCREGNPMMPSNRVGAYAVSFSLMGIETLFAERERKHGQRGWWLAPAISSTVHTGAAISNMARFSK